MATRLRVPNGGDWVDGERAPGRKYDAASIDRLMDARPGTSAATASKSAQRSTTTSRSTSRFEPLVLALIGIYALVACWASQQRQEIGVRMALGARRVEVVRLVIRQGMGFALVGMALGVAGALL
jgi:putative ABC transport system permease protein